MIWAVAYSRSGSTRTCTATSSWRRVLAKGGQHWVFAYHFAKQDRANIDPDELAAFRKLAQAYGRMTDAELASALSQGDLQELFP